MKKICTLLLGVILCCVAMTACNNHPQTNDPGNDKNVGLSSGIYYPDSVLNRYVWRVFLNSTGHFVLPYDANVTVDTTTNPPTLTTIGQAGSYSNTVSINTKGSLNGTQTLCSTGSTIGPDTVRQINYLGPFDPVAGHFYSSKGQLHYVYSNSKDSIVGYISQLIWMNQSSNGGGIAFGGIDQAMVKN